MWCIPLAAEVEVGKESRSAPCRSPVHVLMARSGSRGRAAEARVRIHSLQDEHSGKVTFVERLRKAGLLSTRSPDDSHAGANRRTARGSSFGSSFSSASRW